MRFSSPVKRHNLKGLQNECSRELDHLIFTLHSHERSANISKRPPELVGAFQRAKSVSNRLAMTVLMIVGAMNLVNQMGF